VILKALTVPSPVTVELAASIRPHLPALRNIPYGKKLEKLVKQAYAGVGSPIAHEDLFEVRDDTVSIHSWEPALVDSMANTNQVEYALNLVAPTIPPQFVNFGGIVMPPVSAPILAGINIPNFPSLPAVSTALIMSEAGTNINDDTGIEEPEEFDSLVLNAVKELQID